MRPASVAASVARLHIPLSEYIEHHDTSSVALGDPYALAVSVRYRCGAGRTRAVGVGSGRRPGTCGVCHGGTPGFSSACAGAPARIRSLRPERESTWPVSETAILGSESAYRAHGLLRVPEAGSFPTIPPLISGVLSEAGIDSTWECTTQCFRPPSRTPYEIVEQIGL
jgi:hypothetical protein